MPQTYPQDEPSSSLAPGVLAIFDGIRDGSTTDDERLERGFVVSTRSTVLQTVQTEWS